ncbi:MAG: hypothetical protein VKI42_05480 [Synechococcaceae cyanobacterium]|nr:hypothetical protein [Synechococcaceae cyanobacterium]
MQSSEDGNEGFVMLFTDEGRDTLFPLLQRRQIGHQDVSVLLAVMTHLDWRSGKARVTQKALATFTGMRETHVSASVRKLQRLRLLARVRDSYTGEAFFLLNPALASVGGPQRRGHLAQQFEEAFGGE